jgi:signal transduction histidine kinase
MTGFSSRSAWWLFALSIVLLAAIAYLADRSTTQYARSERWLRHTREVEWRLARLRSDLATFSAESFLAASPAAPGMIQLAARQIASDVDEVHSLTDDNSLQQSNIAKLAAVTQTLAGTPERKGNDEAAMGQARVILDQMQAEEERLLADRGMVSIADYQRLRTTLAVGFFAGLGLIGFIFSALLAQLQVRQSAERAVRRLSAYILVAQDAERRRLARELHDGIGQLFVGIGLEMRFLERSHPARSADSHLENCQRMAEQGLAETRTISYLLHPPMLDELGFEHAVEWYVDGFTKRSKIAVRLALTQPFEPLPNEVSLVLFRVIQEALTNIHRHSGSREAEIEVSRRPDGVSLAIRDFGKGIDPGLLRNIQETSMGAGVGLGGMRERVSEFRGRFSIESSPAGTTVRVSIPLPWREDASKSRPPAAIRTDFRSA